MNAVELETILENQRREFQEMQQNFQAELQQARSALAQAQAAHPAAVPQPQGDAPEINSLAVRLPNFWTSSPELWFAQAEANFETRNPKITSDVSKYSHTLQALLHEVLMDVQHAITATGQNRYAVVKAALLTTFGKSPAQKTAELLAMVARPGGLVGRRPSNIMMKIRTLTDSNYDNLERAMFLSQVPAAVRTALASSKARTNDELCQEVDAIDEEFKLANAPLAAPHAVAQVKAAPAHVQVDAVASRYRPIPAPRKTHQDGLCYVHRKFGKQAYVCKSPATCPMRSVIVPAPGNDRAGR